MTQSKKRPISHSIAAFGASSVATLITYPLDVVKVRFQIDRTKGALPSILSQTSSIVHKEGLFILWSGIFPALIASGISWSGFFIFMKLQKKRWSPERSGMIRDAAASVEAGSIMVLITNPIWLIKTRLQLPNSPYLGFLDAFTRIIQEEGIRALYRGVVPALLLTSHGVIQLTIYEELKRFREPSGSTAGLALVYGSIAKLSAALITYPYQVVKTRVQQRYTNPNSKYAYDLPAGELARTIRCIRDTWQVEGFRGFLKGCWPNSLRVIPNAGITFWVYEMIVRRLPSS